MVMPLEKIGSIKMRILTNCTRGHEKWFVIKPTIHCFDEFCTSSHKEPQVLPVGGIDGEYECTGDKDFPVSPNAHLGSSTLG